MASAGARAYNGGLGQSPQWGPGAEPLVRGSGGKAPLKLKAFSTSNDSGKIYPIDCMWQTECF